MNFSDFNEEQFTESNNDNPSAEAPTPQESEGKQEGKKEKTEEKSEEMELEESEIKRKKGPLLPHEKRARVQKRVQKRVRFNELISEAESLVDRNEQIDSELFPLLRMRISEEGIILPIIKRELLRRNIRSLQREKQEIETRIEQIAKELEKLSREVLPR